MTKSNDIVVAITAHNETLMAGPTLRSAEAAILAAEKAGWTVQRVFAFDNVTDECRAYFCRPEYAHWQVQEYSFKDQGKVRNAVAQNVAGRWLAFLDADDLFSENWLAKAAALCAAAETDRRRVIVHPELNWIFDRINNIVVKPDPASVIFSPYFYYFSNYYDALCFAPTEAYTEVPYSTRNIANGFAYEDWLWNIETMAAGWDHVIAMDTVIFKRRRAESQTMKAGQRRAVIARFEHLAIDRIRRLNDRQRYKAG